MLPSSSPKQPTTASIQQSGCFHPAVPSSQPLLPSSSQLLACPFLLVLHSDFVKPFRQRLLSLWQIGPLAYCMRLFGTDKWKIPKNIVNKGKQSVVDELDILERLSILFESVPVTMIVICNICKKRNKNMPRLRCELRKQAAHRLQLHS